MYNDLETRDLIIRPSVVDDIETFYLWEQESAVKEFFSIAQNQSFETVIRTFIHADEDPEQRQYTIILKKARKPIGRIVLAGLIEGWKVEIFRIYIADPALRNRGLGKQAMKALLKLCFEDLAMERVYLDHYTGNPASHLYLSLGFCYEGVLRRNCRKNDKLYDVHLMSILRDEYFC